MVKCIQVNKKIQITWFLYQFIPIKFHNSIALTRTKSKLQIFMTVHDRDTDIICGYPLIYYRPEYEFKTNTSQLCYWNSKYLCSLSLKQLNWIRRNRNLKDLKVNDSNHCRLQDNNNQMVGSTERLDLLILCRISVNYNINDS